jgi:hypothetical protein
MLANLKQALVFRSSKSAIVAASYAFLLGKTFSILPVLCNWASLAEAASTFFIVVTADFSALGSVVEESVAFALSCSCLSCSTFFFPCS